MASTSQKLKRERERQTANREVKAYLDLIENLVSLHKECRAAIDWRSQADQVAPSPPTFKPTLLDQLRRREAFQSGSHQRKVEEFERAYRAWKDKVQRARSVLAHKPDAYAALIEKQAPFASITDLGAKVSLMSIAPSAVELNITSFALDVVPTVEKSVLSSGRLSTKSLSQTRLAALRQDYMSSAALRAARELLSLLPIERVLVHVDDEFLETSTGHYMECTMVSVLVDRTTLAAINFDLIDPSDAMSNFNHAMNKATSRGMRPVERLDAMTLAFTTGSRLNDPAPRSLDQRRRRGRSGEQSSEHREGITHERAWDTPPPAEEGPAQQRAPSTAQQPIRAPQPSRQEAQSPAPPPAPQPARHPARSPMRLPTPLPALARELTPAPSEEQLAAFLDGLRDKEQRAARVLAENRSVSTADLGRALDLSGARVGGLMRKLKQQARAEGMTLFTEEPLPNGEQQYIYTPPAGFKQT